MWHGLQCTPNDGVPHRLYCLPHRHSLGNKWLFIAVMDSGVVYSTRHLSSSTKAQVFAAALFKKNKHN